MAAMEPPWDRSAGEVIDHIGLLIDAAGDGGKAAGAHRAIQQCERLRREASLAPVEAALLDYFEANAWSLLAPCTSANPAEAWAWRHVALDNAIRLLRRAQRSSGFSGLGLVRQSQICTNLGNALDTLGRFVEALGYYRAAVEASPDHGMAQGNLGVCLATYGTMLPAQSHPPGFYPLSAFLVRAWTHLVAALNTPLPPDAGRSFSDMRTRVEGLLQLAEKGKAMKLGGKGRWKTKKERRYREWCLAECLFLNPLNDLDVFDEAATDILYIPPVVDDSVEGHFILSLFNQVKQEYATARFLLYEGVENKTAHFADRDVLLVNTLDHAAHSLCVENVRIAFRMAYAVFDKIAVLVNYYLKLGLNPRHVSFRTIWYEKEKANADLKPLFRDRQNWPLRGLFGLSRDLCMEGDGREALDPDAQELVAIRHHPEHRHLTVHEESWIGGRGGPGGEAPDQQSFAIDRRDLESRALRIMKLARSALVYFVHAVAIEEEIRAAARPVGDVIIPRVFPPVDDRDKR